MNKSLVKSLYLFFISAIFAGVSFCFITNAEAASNLNGRILLQVEEKGQAWYVNPLDSKRYFLGSPDDAYNLMRRFGLGVSNKDLSAFLKTKAPLRLAGRILLKVEDRGQAYYIDPISLKLSYLGKAYDAFQVIRQKGLGISNANLFKIPLSTTSATPKTSLASVNTNEDAIANNGSQRFVFKYKNIEREISQGVSSSWYSIYQSSPKVYTYSADNIPNNLREEFYGMFLKLKSGDTLIDEIIAKLKIVATQNNWTEDETLEFIISFVQYIPYDQAKADSGNVVAYYPYETLYLDKGVCSDKTFLAMVILRKLGYGAAVLDFPDINHTALGISCPLEYSINNSGYCYVETTNYFPFGVIPQNIKGQALAGSEKIDNLFDSANLGTMEILQRSSGKLYQRIVEIRSQAQRIKDLKISLSARQSEISNLNFALENKEAELSVIKNQLDGYLANGQTSQYNSLVPVYNSGTVQYNGDLNIYQAKINEYNQGAAEFNSLIKDFYQT